MRIVGGVFKKDKGLTAGGYGSLQAFMYTVVLGQFTSGVRDELNSLLLVAYLNFLFSMHGK